VIDSAPAEVAWKKAFAERPNRFEESGDAGSSRRSSAFGVVTRRLEQDQSQISGARASEYERQGPPNVCAKAVSFKQGKEFHQDESVRLIRLAHARFRAVEGIWHTSPEIRSPNLEYTK
jgi:hypothetical protein